MSQSRQSCRPKIVVKVLESITSKFMPSFSRKTVTFGAIKSPRSSRATIYNNLRDLVQAGLVREVPVEGRAARFDVKSMRHHHFICDRCGNVEDLEWYDVPRPAAASLGIRMLRESELILRGLCGKCAPRRASR